MKAKAHIAVFLVAGFLRVAAAQTATDNWQAKAVQKYPELGVRGSELNTRFIATYNARRKTDPKFFANPQWPIILADELAIEPPVPPIESAPSAPLVLAPEPVAQLKPHTETRPSAEEPLTEPTTYHAPSAVSHSTWPTIDQIGEFLANAAVVVVLLFILAIGILIAVNWKTVKTTSRIVRIVHVLYKMFFGS